ncbi:MAG: hypothetical protein ACI9JM_003202 [Halioglobus sp.]|jgi:hypothetical protein
MRIQSTLYLLLIPLLVGCSNSLTTDCLSLAPPGAWTKIAAPEQSVIATFQRTESTLDELWFQNGDEEIGMCYSCAPASAQARSFQVASEEPATQACAGDTNAAVSQ